MNHTQRIAHVARQRRSLTKALVRDIVERYLESLAEEIASGEWIDIPYIGKVQVIREKADSILYPFAKGGRKIERKITRRLRTKIRLNQHFRQRCKSSEQLL